MFHRLTVVCWSIVSLWTVSGIHVTAQAQSPPEAPAAPQDKSTIASELLLVQTALTALESSKSAEAREALNALLICNPESWVHVLIAASWSLEGKRDEAFQSLDSALTGFERDPLSAGPLCCGLAEELTSDPKWQSIRSDTRFDQLLTRAKKATWYPEVLKFDFSRARKPLRYPRPNKESPKLKELREAYRLDSVVAKATDDLDRVKRMCHWVHTRTSHEGWRDDYPTDALTLL